MKDFYEALCNGDIKTLKKKLQKYGSIFLRVCDDDPQLIRGWNFYRAINSDNYIYLVEALKVNTSLREISVSNHLFKKNYGKAIFNALQNHPNLSHIKIQIFHPVFYDNDTIPFIFYLSQRIPQLTRITLSGGIGTNEGNIFYELMKSSDSLTCLENSAENAYIDYSVEKKVTEKNLRDLSEFYDIKLDLSKRDAPEMLQKAINDENFKLLRQELSKLPHIEVKLIAKLDHLFRFLSSGFLIDETEINIFSEGLAASKNLKSLHIEGRSTSSLVKLIQAVMKSESLEELSIRDIKINKEVAQTLSDFLATTRNLKKLSILFSSIQNDAQSDLCFGLKNNKTLEFVCFYKIYAKKPDEILISLHSHVKLTAIMLVNYESCISGFSCNSIKKFLTKNRKIKIVSIANIIDTTNEVVFLIKKLSLSLTEVNLYNCGKVSEEDLIDCAHNSPTLVRLSVRQATLNTWTTTETVGDYEGQSEVERTHSYFEYCNYDNNKKLREILISHQYLKSDPFPDIDINLLAPVILLRPTDYEYIFMSNDAYNDMKKIGDKPWKEKEWRVFKIHDHTDSGYFGVAYINDNTKNIVIAHRGIITKDFIHGINEHIEAVIKGRLTNQHLAALNFSLQVIHAANNFKKPYHVSFTGHCLGGWLAQLCVYYFQDAGYYTRAVTLDNPGCKEILELFQPRIKPRFKLDEMDVVTYLSCPNLINCSNTHIGTVYRIYPNINKESKAFSFFDNPFYSLESHSVKILVELFDETSGVPKKYTEVEDWPRINFVTDPIKKIQTGDYENCGKAIIPSLSGITGSLFSTPAAAITSIAEMPVKFISGKLVSAMLNAIHSLDYRANGLVNLIYIFADWLRDRIDKSEYDLFQSEVKKNGWITYYDPENYKSNKLTELALETKMIFHYNCHYRVANIKNEFNIVHCHPDVRRFIKLLYKYREAIQNQSDFIALLRQYKISHEVFPVLCNFKQIKKAGKTYYLTKEISPYKFVRVMTLCYLMDKFNEKKFSAVLSSRINMMDIRFFKSSTKATESLEWGRFETREIAGKAFRFFDGPSLRMAGQVNQACYQLQKEIEKNNTNTM